MTERNFGQNQNIFIGEVVDINDPHQSGRVKIRIFGLHDDRTNIPDSSLPWAQTVSPVTSANIGRIGTSPVGAVVGTKVFGMFVDRDQQLPVIMGTVGRAGDLIPGQTTNGYPAVNISTGSVPPSSQGYLNNPYTSLYSGRTGIRAIDSGGVNITSVDRRTGGSLTLLAQGGMSNYGLPTIGSYDRNSRIDVLDIINSVDPLSTLASLPCLNFNLISLRSILSFLNSIISGIVSLVAQAITNAILKLAQRLGIFKLLGLLNAAIQGIKEIAALINALNLKICGVNLINQGLFDMANYAMASVIGGLNSAVGAIVGGLNTVINTATGAVLAAGSTISAGMNTAITNLVNSGPVAPGSSVITATSRVPNSPYIVSSPPPGYIQQYHQLGSDPYPGYIEWRHPTGATDPFYTLRNGEPNYINAQQHTLFAAQDHFTTTIGATLLSGRPLTFNTLANAVSGSINFTQGFALSRVLGAGAQTAAMIGVVAALVPTVVVGINSVFNPNNSRATHTQQTTAMPVNNYVTQQALLARMRTNMRAGLYVP